jgi:hypothetical protein
MAIETNGTPVIMGGDSGFGGGAGFWGFLILAMFLFGGSGFGGFGGNNGNANAIQADVNRGFDNQNLQAQTRDILSAVTSGTAQSVSATNQTFHDTLNALNDKYSELARDIAGVSVAQAEALANQNQCCCNTLRAIDGVNYNNAMNTASINANTTAQTQKILDAIAGNRMADMQNQINQLQLAQALNGVVRYPNGMTYNAGTSPFCNCGGCGCMA